MSDREKAFVINGLRNHLRWCANLAGINADTVDQKLLEITMAMMIEPAILELTRHEQQELLAEIIEAGGGELLQEN